MSEEDFSKLRGEDVVWLLCRMNIENYPWVEYKDTQNIPSWSVFNSATITDNRELQVVGFLPVLPYPVTEYFTFYTTLCNAKDIAKRLKQRYLPIFCDEGVYYIGRHIQILNEEEFKEIIILLGDFYLIEVACACIGKYSTDSGVNDI